MLTLGQGGLQNSAPTCFLAPMGPYFRLDGFLEYGISLILKILHDLSILYYHNFPRFRVLRVMQDL